METASGGTGWNNGVLSSFIEGPPTWEAGLMLAWV
jgi:hypothetical protein